jgi:hypothetical protein
MSFVSILSHNLKKGKTPKKKKPKMISNV